MKMSLLGMNEAAHLKMKICPNLSKDAKKIFRWFYFLSPYCYFSGTSTSSGT